MALFDQHWFTLETRIGLVYHFVDILQIVNHAHINMPNVVGFWAHQSNVLEFLSRSIGRDFFAKQWFKQIVISPS